MKTLYIDINNAPIEGNVGIELLSYDLQKDFYYSLGESIKGKVRGVSSNIDLVEKYIESGENAEFIEEAWKTVKEVLFSENPEEDVTITLPREYLEWLRYNNDDSYRNIYEQLYSGKRSTSVTIDMEELYEDVVSGTLYRQIRRCLKDNVDIEELVFNDNCVSRKSVIVRTIKKNFENVGFVPFEKWERPTDGEDDRVCKKCKQNPCECKTGNDELFPFHNVVLGVTNIEDIEERPEFIFEEDGWRQIAIEEDGIVFFETPYNDKITVLFMSNDSATKFPKEWREKLGLQYGMSLNNCQAALHSRGFTTKLKRKNVFHPFKGENCDYFVAISPDERYFLELYFGEGKFSALIVSLSKCPNCSDVNIWIEGDKIPLVFHCQNEKCGYEWTTLSVEEDDEEDDDDDNWDDDDDDDDETPNCPKCESEDVEDDGTGYLQYLCNDCGNRWGDDTEECPYCGAKDCVDDGTGYIQYTCNECGEVWGDDDD